MAKPRWCLNVQAIWWRMLMAIGMYLHKLAPPRPPPPSFSRRFPTTISPQPGTVNLQFYTPEGYSQRGSKKYPVVVNYHGGGFTIGTGTDDARWADVITKCVGAVFVSVEYRLGPDFPFPTAVEDGADAVLYLADRADEFGIDPHQMAISGFSAGGNLAFTVPLKLQEQIKLVSNPAKPQQLMNEAPTYTLKAIVAWYPLTDSTRTRAERRATNIHTEQHLPTFFTNLFDAAYLPEGCDVSDPYLSPGVAPDDMLSKLPDDIIIYACECDMLLEEDKVIAARLEKDLGKNVKFQIVEGVPHAWDRSANPFVMHPEVARCYREACIDLKRIFSQP